MNFIEYFEKCEAQKIINRLVYQYKDKKIVLYGAGQFADTLFENYDLSKLNIVAIADMKFEDESKRSFHNLNCIPPKDLGDFDCDVILISNFDYNLFYNLISNYLINTKNSSIKIRPLIEVEYIIQNGEKIIKKTLDDVYDSLNSVPVKIESETYLSLDEINEHLDKIYKENNLIDAYHTAHRNRFLLTLSQIPVCKNPNEVILEIGSFTYFSLFLKEILGYENIYGLDRYDSQEKTVAITRNIMNKEHKQTVFNVNLDDISGYEALEHSDIKFDKIIFMEVLEHLYKPTLSLIKFRDILKETGLLILTTPNSSSLVSLARLFNMRIPMVYGRMDFNNVYKMHVREYTPIFLKYLLKCSGYVEKSFNTINAYNFPVKEFMYNLYPFPKQPDLNKKLIHDTLVSISSPNGEIITQEPDILYDVMAYSKDEFIRHNIPIDRFLSCMIENN